MLVKNIVRGQSVSHELHERAKKLRREMTPAEGMLWKEIRTNELNGLHFRRQQIIDGYIADFYCHQHALIIEVDGSIHENQKEDDVARTEHLIARGFRVIRFMNDEIEQDLKDALQRIVEKCKQ